MPPPTPPPVPPPNLPAPPRDPTLNLPPDVLDRLSPAHSWQDWVYTNAATLVAALVAVGAAMYAWKAVCKQIDANAAQLKEELDATAANVQRQIDADRQSRRRAIQVDLLTETFEAANQLFHFVIHPANRVPSDETLRRREEVHNRMNFVVTKLGLFDLIDETRQVHQFMAEAVRFYEGQPDPEDNFPETYLATARTLKDAVAE